MRKIYSLFAFALLLLVTLSAVSCTKDPVQGRPEGARLNIHASFDNGSRLAELPGPGDISTGDDLRDLGVYVYYKSDWDDDNLAKPYIRNRKFTVNSDGVATLETLPGESKDIYVYDHMVVVAFYPYNPEMSEEENWFENKADQEKYPVTRPDYSTQVYIPYMAVNNDVNPTNAYFTHLRLTPKHTYKIEIVLVSEDEDALPAEGNDGTDGLVKILPDIDPFDTGDEQVGKRAAWFDIMKHQGHDGSGSYYQQYTAYIWTADADGVPNDIEQGTWLMEAGDLSLIASQRIPVVEGNVYRYGFNLSTGKVFIPTSSKLVNDANSLRGVSIGKYYQVCDIDMAKQGNPWKPIQFNGTFYDGGGNKVLNMHVEETTDDCAGLFSILYGDLYNLHMVDPVINVDADDCYVGALAGKANHIPDGSYIADLKRYIYASLPAEMSETVKKALMYEILSDMLGSTVNISGCKVENPVIEVNGENPTVGGFVGKVGEFQILIVEEGVEEYQANSRAFVYDSYSLGGSIMVNDGAPEKNEHAKVGGFVGFNGYTVINSYTTMQDITAMIEYEVPDDSWIPGPEETEDDRPTITVEENIAMGFGYIKNRPGEYGDEDDGSGDNGATQATSYALNETDKDGGLDDANQFVTDGWPDWGTYTQYWPVYYIGRRVFWYNMGTSPDQYPTLQLDRK